MLNIYQLLSIGKKFLNKSLTFSEDTKSQLLEKISLKRNFVLNNRLEVAQGIVCPQDFLNRGNSQKLGNKYEIGTGIFIISNLEKKEMKFTKDEQNLVKPLYSTNELIRFYGNKVNSEW